MPKVAYTGEHHGQPVLVRRGDDFGVAHAAAGLDDRARAGAHDHVEAIPERENASDATTEPANSSLALCALMAAMRAESTRLIWPAPTPTVIPSRQKTMALDFTNLATRQANNRSASCSGVGGVRVTTRNSAAPRFRVSGLCTSTPPPTRLKS